MSLAAIAILNKYPELLFRGGTITDHFGRQIKASPYQIFLGTGDIWALKQVHEEILPKIENGKTIAKEEFQMQFPDYRGHSVLDSNIHEEVLYDKRNKEQISEVIAQLKIIVEKISADPCTKAQATKEETTKAVADLEQILAPKKGEIIKTGLHYPLGILKKISQVYHTQFNLWSGSQLAYFCRGVIGGAEAGLTAVDGQCFKDGLANFNLKKGPDRRDGLFCRHPKGIPENETPLASKLGRTIFLDPDNGFFYVVSSLLGFFDWYNKFGYLCLSRCSRPKFRPMTILEDLWKTKAETYGRLLCPRAEESTPTLLS